MPDRDVLTEKELNARLAAIDEGMVRVEKGLTAHAAALTEVGRFINRYARHTRDCAVVGVRFSTIRCTCGFADSLQTIWHLVPELNVEE